MEAKKEKTEGSEKHSIVVVNKRRLEGEWKGFQKEPLEDIDVYYDKDKPLEWFFIIKGVKKSPYEGGEYIGKIEVPEKYPFSAPDIMLMTPSGRFEINKKICLSNTGFHQEEWSALWTLSTILQAFSSVFENDKETGLSHIRESKELRLKYAKESIDYNKKNLNHIYSKFPRFGKEKTTSAKKETTTDKKIKKDDEETTDKKKVTKEEESSEKKLKKKEDKEEDEEESPEKKPKKKVDKKDEEDNKNKEKKKIKKDGKKDKDEEDIDDTEKEFKKLLLEQKKLTGKKK